MHQQKRRNQLKVIRSRRGRGLRRKPDPPCRGPAAATLFRNVTERAEGCRWERTGGRSFWRTRAARSLSDCEENLLKVCSPRSSGSFLASVGLFSEEKVSNLPMHDGMNPRRRMLIRWWRASWVGFCFYHCYNRFASIFCSSSRDNLCFPCLHEGVRLLLQVIVFPQLWFQAASVHPAEL